MPHGYLGNWKQTKESEGSSWDTCEREAGYNQMGADAKAQERCQYHDTDKISNMEAVRGDLHHSLGVTWRPQKRMSINFQTKTIFYYKENKKLNRKGNIIVMAQL